MNALIELSEAEKEKIRQNEREDEAFTENLARFLDPKQAHTNAPIDIGATPNSLVLAGADIGLKLIIRPDTITKCMRSATKDEHGHLLSEEIMRSLPIELRNPMMILKGSHDDSLVVVTALKDKENREIIISVGLESKQDFGIVNRITSAYGKKNFSSYLNKQLNGKNLIAINKEKAEKMLRPFRLQLPAGNTFISFDNSIAYTTANVKYPAQKIKEIKMQVSKEQISSAREANLADFFRSSGCECEQHGAELHVRGFGGLYINTNTNSWYQFAEQRGDKNPVNCLTEVLGMDFTSAVSALSTVTGFEKSFSGNISYNTEKTAKEKKQSMELPINEHEKKRVFAYLIKERKIDAKLVQELVDKKLLYQGSVKYRDKDGNEALAKGNAVFLQKDKEGNIVGAEIHGTNTYKSFKAIAGAGDENLFQYSIGAPKKVYAFESAIDLLSFKMLANPEKIQNSLLVSMGGLKPNALKKLEASGLKIYSCVDNDERGKKFNEANGFQPANKKLSEESVKDWNELLQKRVRELSKNFEAPAEKSERKSAHKSSPKR